MEHGSFWGPIRGKIRKILLNLQKSSSHEPLVPLNDFISKTTRLISTKFRRKHL